MFGSSFIACIYRGTSSSEKKIDNRTLPPNKKCARERDENEKLVENENRTFIFDVIRISPTYGTKSNTKQHIKLPKRRRDVQLFCALERIEGELARKKLRGKKTTLQARAVDCTIGHKKRIKRILKQLEHDGHHTKTREQFWF